jgi:RND family efflux transporter MFP subunit
MTDESQKPEPKSRLGRAVALAIVGAVVAWGAVRVSTALKVKKAVAEEREATAKKAETTQTVPTTVVRGVAETWAPVVPFDGTMAASRETDLGFKVGGRLATVRVKVGDCVGSGAVLGVLDSTEAAAQLQAAEAQVRAAVAQLELAHDSRQRTTALVGAGAASQQLGVQSSGQAALATAQADSAKAQLALAQAALRNHTLTAPFGGCLTRVPSGIGGIVGPGVPLYHLQDTTTLKLVGTLAESDAQIVHPGASVELSHEGTVFRGKVMSVLDSVDAATRRVPVEATFANKADTRLRANTFVRASVVGLPSLPALRLPASAIRPGSQDEVVLVKNGLTEIRRVAFTATRDGAVVVRRGLDAADSVLLQPTAETTSGQKVNTVEQVAAKASRPSPSPDGVWKGEEKP